jgi:hypothetical protein
MNFIRILHILKLSFYSKEFYRDVYHNLTGFKVTYLLVLILFCNLAFIVPLYGFFYKILNYPSADESEVAFIINQFPTMHVKKGLLFVEGEEPVFGYSRDKEKIVVIDTAAFPSKYEQMKIPIFINKEGVFLLYKSYNQTLKFSNFFPTDTVVAHDFLKDKMEAMRNMLFSVVFIFYLITTLTTLFFIALKLIIFALLGRVYGKVIVCDLKFKSLSRVAVFATFPPLIIDATANVYLYLTRYSFTEFQAALYSPLKINLIFIISILYFYFALKSCVIEKRAKSKN